MEVGRYSNAKEHKLGSEHGPATVAVARSMLANKTLSHMCLAAEPMPEVVGVPELRAAALKTASGAIQEYWDEPAPADAPPDRFLQFCTRSFGEFHGPQVAQDTRRKIARVADLGLWPPWPRWYPLSARHA